MVAAFPLGFPALASAVSVARARWTDTQPASGPTAPQLREFAAAINESVAPASPWRGEALMALAVLTDAQRWLLQHHSEVRQPTAIRDALTKFDASSSTASAVLATRFDVRFPNQVSSTVTWTAEDAARELVLVRLMRQNLAASAYRSLFDDAATRADTALDHWGDHIEAALQASGPAGGVGNAGDDVMTLLRAPLLAVPDSLEGQLAFFITHMGALLPDWILTRLQRTQGVLAEASTTRGAGPGPSEALRFDGPLYQDDDDSERFTDDQGWMPDVVMIAKSTHVWLDQLSRALGRPVTRLDAIPDETLDALAQAGFNALWLIGTWQRSDASRRIKQRMGNSEALASAYSLDDYRVADGLGGEPAWETLKKRCAERGIRLATDMVPNHTGLDSDWMVHHPERFLQLTTPPYPGYTFDGPDLSADPRVGVFLEDGYWDHSDAAVVFKRLDHHTGDVRYVYHGNDGTQMPWNDTAQLDYANVAVREAVIQTILAVARRAPIIRFDAAMTLARRHVRRLWHPPPGEAGAIPSRSEHGLSPDAFERAVPAEFWREVVERVQQEAPDTLLVAEAFWMMEGYFVRTLGMHRVYNSAFMHMLRDEDNAKLRASIKNVLSYSPPILQRFVNFMNNPDEETAVEQFGKDDKYFGVALLLVTLPGLPMFGHGQVEGLTEKYGMEYARAYRDEQPDAALIARHGREIFPLMRRRHLFSQVEDFALFDVQTEHGGVAEAVYAYSNAHPGRDGVERAVVLYNNAYAGATGWVREAAPQLAAGSEDPQSRSFTDALGIEVGPGRLVSMRELHSDLTCLHWTESLATQGFRVELLGYGKQVWVDIREVTADAFWNALMQHGGQAGFYRLDVLLGLVHSDAARMGDVSALAGDARDYLGVHTHDGVDWLLSERLSTLADILLLGEAAGLVSPGVSATLTDVASASGYDYERLLLALEAMKAPPATASAEETDAANATEEE